MEPKKIAGALLAALLVRAALAAEPAPVQPLQALPYTPSLNLPSMDRSVEPCEDFYRYSCGGWIRSNPIPADQASWSVYGKLATENLQYLWGILERSAQASDRSPVQQKIGDYYAACMDERSIDAAGLRPLQGALDRIAALATRAELIAAIPGLHRGTPGSFFFDSGTEQDAADATLVIAAIGAGGLGLPDRDYYTRGGRRDVEIRARYAAYITTLMTRSGMDADAAAAAARDVIDIETTLARASLTRVEQRDPHRSYHPMALRRLQALAPAIAWPHYFDVQGAPGLQRLNVSQPAFFEALQRVLTRTPLPALRNYLRFHALTAAAPQLARPFADAHFDFYSHVLRGVEQPPPRWKTCTRGVDRQLGEALGEEFVRRTFSAKTKASVQRMTEQVEAAMRQEIEGLTWMSAPTKAAALAKLAAIRNKIGYPDHWRDYSALEIRRDDYYGNVLRASLFEDRRQWAKLGKPVDRDEWGMTPPTVNAYFDAQLNDINFPAGVLQPPLYDPKGDDAPNYGNTGATIGHELTHAFDDEGRQFDAHGNLRDWWTPADARGFEQRIQCLRDQFAGFVVVDDIHINSKLTSGEDVADLGGTLLGYLAWKMQTAGQSLPDIDGFTPDQRYFIGMAQWACESERPENLRVNALTNPHSPGWARINGIVSNMPEFERAFSCKPGQAMVHRPACRVW